MWHDIQDDSLTLDYQWVDNETLLWGEQPVYETHELQVKVVESANVTNWVAVPITETQTDLRAEKSWPGDAKPFAAFEGDSLAAGSGLRIAGGGDVTLSGVVRTTGAAADVTVTAGRDFIQQGLAPAGPADPETLSAQAEVHASGAVTISAGGALRGDHDSLLESQGGGIRLTAGGVFTAGATMESATAITLETGDTLTLSGRLSAASGIEASDIGGIGGDLYGDLNVTGAEGVIRLSAASVDLDRTTFSSAHEVEITASNGLTLDGVAITATDAVRLTSASGAIAHGQAEIDSALLTLRGVTGVQAALADGVAVDAVASGSGDIVLRGFGGATLSHLETAAGAIRVEANGALEAVDVQALGGSDAADVTLITHGGDLNYATVAVTGDGDLTLDVDGAIATSGSPLLSADQLTVKSRTAMNLATAVRAIAVESRVAGDVIISNSGAGALEVVSALVRDGSFQVTGGGGLTLTRVELATNRDGVAITATAGGDLAVGYLEAGDYSTDPGETRDLYSRGDVTLVAAGAVRGLATPAQGVHLVAGQLSIGAASGITGLELAVNELLAVTTDAGDVSLADHDGTGAFAPGLTLTRVETGQGSVNVAGEGFLQACSVTAGGAAGSITLATGGNLWVVEPESGQALTFGDSLTLDAGGMLQLGRGYTATGTLALLAGDALDLPPLNGAPLSAQADRLIIHTGQSLDLAGTLVAGSLLDLASDASLNFQGAIQGLNGDPIGAVNLSASGAREVSGRLYDGDSAMPIKALLSDPGGQQYLYNQASGKYYIRDDNGLTDVTGTVDPDQLTPVYGTLASGWMKVDVQGIRADAWSVSAALDITLTTVDDLALSGTIGGVEAGTANSGYITIGSAGRLDMTGLQLRAGGDATLSGSVITMDDNSLASAQNLTASAAGGISLFTRVESVKADNSGTGDITIFEQDALLLTRAATADGAIHVRARHGDLSVLDAHVDADGAGRDITLESGHDIIAEYVETGVDAGAAKTGGAITFNTVGTVREGDYVDPSQDALAYAVTFNTGDDLPTDAEALEVFSVSDVVTQSLGAPKEQVAGDYTLSLPFWAGSLVVDVTGTLTVASLEIDPDTDITFRAGGDMVLGAGIALQLPQADIHLTAGGLITIANPIAAAAFSVASMAMFRIAQHDEAVAFQAYRLQQMDILFNALIGYLDLSMAQELLVLRREALRIAERLLGDAQARVVEGRLAETGLLPILSSVSQRRISERMADQTLVAARDKVREALFLSAGESSEGLNATVNLLDVPMVEPDLHVSQKMGLDLRPEYLTAKRIVEREGVRLRYLENQDLPKLDLYGTYGANGLDSSSSNSVNGALHDGHEEWSVGIRFEVPLMGGKTEKSELEAGRLRKRKALLEVQAVEVDVLSGINTLVRQVENTRQQLTLMRRIEEAARRQWEVDQARYREGRVEFATLMERHGAWITARESTLQYGLAYRKALLGLKLAEGSLLAHLGVE